MSDLAQVGAGQLAEIEQGSEALAARGIDTDSARSASRLTDARGARGPLKSLVEQIESRLGPDDASLAPVLELLGFCTSKPEVTVAMWSRALAIRAAASGSYDARATNIRYVLATFHAHRGNRANTIALLEPLLAACEDGSAGHDDRVDQSLGGSAASLARPARWTSPSAPLRRASTAPGERPDPVVVHRSLPLQPWVGVGAPCEGERSSRS